jgi:hypothetical protein
VKTVPALRQALWEKIILAVQNEWQSLAGSERSWIDVKIERLTAIQTELHRLVAVAEGEAICRDCHGGCCGHGLYHPTLVTLIAHLTNDQSLPVPDFYQSCPYLGGAGCTFPPALRPFNCLIFICDKIEQQCPEQHVATIALLESELRGIYEAFDDRYTGSSLRGLMNRPLQGELQLFFGRK